ncbi:pirin family protein [Pelagibius sp. CAU 1746]|uniref:pirin family protein n=1 Tax=Pelagibius sp. CAU 1746 TaxID=3140370 RepID=UPI00325A7A03
MSESDPVELVIEPRKRDLGGFGVKRILPFAKRRMVGPFIFLDEFGPEVLPVGEGIDVRPHPHIGLATVTYLFEGEILHRDSLGSLQAIRPGAVNLMTAGRGIVHSERSGEIERAREAKLHGMQSWIALPLAEEQGAPGFSHHPLEDLPLIEREGSRLRLLAGRAYGQTSPAPAFSDLFYLHAELEAGARLDLPQDHDERAVYVVSGGVSLGGREYAPGRLLVLKEGAAASLTAGPASRLMLLGGAPLEGKRHIWWNFVASDLDLIEAAKADWREGRFAPVPGDDDAMPLPEE